MGSETLKSINLLISLFLFNILAMSSHATETQMLFSWSGSDDNSAFVEYKSDNNAENKFLEANISHSAEGIQRLYFRDLSSLGNRLCRQENTVPDITTMVFNGQAVKMSRWCKRYSYSSNYYLYLTPETEVGHQYVIDLFKKSLTPVNIQFNGESISFPVMGFTNAWVNAGGDAI